jgi:hypothetical protein
MDRRKFLITTVGVAASIAGLERWHQAFDDAYLAGEEPTSAVAVADTAVPATNYLVQAQAARRVDPMGAIDEILKNYYLPVVKERLQRYHHSCGAPYDIHWLNRDGEIVKRYSLTQPLGYEFVLVAYCSQGVECPHRETVYNFLRFNIPSPTRPYEVEPFIKRLQVELEGGTTNFERHLAEVHPQDQALPASV